MIYPKNKSKKLSKNFSSAEFNCHCQFKSCDKTKIDSRLIKNLQSKRDEWGRAIKINSGYRCKKWNQVVGGAKKSQHLLGKAADIVVEGWGPLWVSNRCEDFNGLGRYKTFTHVDVRDRKARWGQWLG